MLRQARQPVFVIANKADNDARRLDATEFYSLGLEQVFDLLLHLTQPEGTRIAFNTGHAKQTRYDAPGFGQLLRRHRQLQRSGDSQNDDLGSQLFETADSTIDELRFIKKGQGLGFSLEEIGRARTETAEIDGRVEAFEAASRGRQSKFGFRSYWKWWWFVPAILLLVAVDWVANVPVFQELLPQDADLSGAWQVLAAEAELHGALAGLYRMWYRIALSPEVALLALGVIVFLVVLAHIFGESVRRVVAVSEQDVPEAGRSVRQYRRQFWIPATVGLVGGIAVVTFLFLARQEIATFAETRLTAVNEEITTLDTQIASATEAGSMSDVARLSALRPELDFLLLAGLLLLRHTDGIHLWSILA